MSRFYVHLDNGKGLHRDVEGADFADADAARQHAIEAGADIIADEIKQGQRKVKATMIIEDADRRLVAMIPMSASIGA